MSIFSFGYDRTRSTTRSTDNAWQKQRSGSWGANDAWGGSQSSVYGPQSRALDQLYYQGRNFVNPWQTSSRGAAATAGMIPQLQQTMGNLAQMANPERQIEQRAASLRSGLGDLFRDEINPALEGTALASGGFGGGRQGVAQGVATGQLADAYTSGLGDIVADADRTALGASAALPGIASALYDARMAPEQAGLGVLQQLADILGPAVMQDRSFSGSRSRSGGWSRGDARDTSTSKSTTKKDGFDFSLF